MKEETANEVMEGLEGTLGVFTDATGKKPSREQAMSMFEAFVYYLAMNDPKHKKAHDTLAECNGDFKAFLLRQPEPTEEDKEKTKNLLRNLPFLLRPAIISAAKNIPYRHRGGRLPFDGNKKREEKAVNAVALRLVISGNLSEALQYVAKQEKVSSKTMRRAWNRHMKESNQALSRRRMKS